MYSNTWQKSNGKCERICTEMNNGILKESNSIMMTIKVLSLPNTRHFLRCSDSNGEDRDSNLLEGVFELMSKCCDCVLDGKVTINCCLVETAMVMSGSRCWRIWTGYTSAVQRNGGWNGAGEGQGCDIVDNDAARHSVRVEQANLLRAGDSNVDIRLQC